LLVNYIEDNVKFVAIKESEELGDCQDWRSGGQGMMPL
jgi:hypothetical protein